MHSHTGHEQKSISLNYLTMQGAITKAFVVLIE